MASRKRNNVFEIENILGAKKERKELGNSLKDCCEKLVEVRIEELRGQDCSENDAVTWLVAKFGFKEVNKAFQAYDQLPETLTSHQKLSYLNDRPAVMKIIEMAEELCPSLFESFDKSTDQELILAPPVKHCLDCECRLTSNHSCIVKAYGMSRAVNGRKYTLRCKSCALIYNYATYGNKSRDGFRHYDAEHIQDFVEVTDTVYLERSLVEFYCSLA